MFIRHDNYLHGGCETYHRPALRSRTPESGRKCVQSSISKRRLDSDNKQAHREKCHMSKDGYGMMGEKEILLKSRERAWVSCGSPLAISILPLPTRSVY